MGWRLVAENRETSEFISDNSSFEEVTDVNAGPVLFEGSCMDDAEPPCLELYVEDKGTLCFCETFGILVEAKYDDDVILSTTVIWLVITTV